MKNHTTMNLIKIGITLYCIISVAFCDDATEAPSDWRSSYTSNHHDSSKIHEEKKIKIENRKFDRETPSSFGIPMHNPRTYGKIPNPANDFIHSPSLGSMRNENWQGRNDFKTHNKEFLPPDGLIYEEDGLINGHQNSGGGGEPCEDHCEDNEFFCSESCQCIAEHLRCDNHVDCDVKGEDEIGCELTEFDIEKIKHECESNPEHVMCPMTFTCIKQSWFCDGDDDCGDFSDETKCVSKYNCSEDSFECTNGLCVPNEWFCDGENDCRDNSDEVNCTRTCSSDEFTCNDDSCVSLAFKCDGDIDCDDGSDESVCDFPLQSCPEGEFKCRGMLGGMGGPGSRCILDRYHCDGDNDCGDWSDEENCPKKLIPCTSNEFKCDDGRCIPLRWRCDSEQDCDSGEDEKDCSDIGPPNRECSDDEYMCKDSRCISKNWVCDGHADCKRGEDEMECETKCEIGQFSCPTKPTTSAIVRDQRKDFCVSQKHICDGHKDCNNGEDEMNCSTPIVCQSNTKCKQLCAKSATGKDECACSIGYVISSDGFTCDDINECEFINNPCSQTCNNTLGSFTCGCISGYVLRPDLRTCKALGGAVKLIMANRGDIRQVTLSNNQYTSIIKGLPNAIALDYHYDRNLLFWSDVSADVIKTSFLNGTAVKDVIKWGLESPGGLAVDWIHDLLFWTDSGTRRVEVSTFDGKLRAVVAANDLDKPRAIVVHPGKYMVFWSDWGPNAKIESSFMDGSERTSITNDGIYWPNGLALDFATDRIYWADAKHHVIESSKLNGADRKKILSNNLPHPFALTIFEDNLYWTDWHTKTISSANKVTGKNFRHVHEGLHFPMDIHSYHKARQPKFVNRCIEDKRRLKGGCSHLCLPNRTSRRCACPIGLTLLEDQKTCTSVPDKILLIARKKDIRMRQLDSKNPHEIDMVIPLDNLKSTLGLDWDSETDRIYWTDTGKSTISRAYLNGSNQETIIADGLVSPAGLALDWITKKFYWTDSGTNRIEVSSLNGLQRALLVWENLLKPRDIVVNPMQGIMFWSDWSDTPLIERAGMDGSERSSIVSENLLYPNGLTVDYTNNRLYFVDAGTKALEFVNFDGTGRNRLKTDNLHHPFGIDVFEKNIFWSDWDLQSVLMADKHSGKNRRNLISNTSDLMDIRVFHRKRQTRHNPCAVRNGGCSHMCLLNAKDPFYSCVCPIGVKLKEDGRSCKDQPTNYILFAHGTDIRQVSLDIPYMIDVVLPLPRIGTVYTLDVDLHTGDIYWADKEEDTIMRSSSSGRNVVNILSESMEDVCGLVICSVTRKIYFTDEERRSVEVCELDGSNRRVLFWKDLEKPRAIAINYESGFLFFSDWGSAPRIERAQMDGEKRARIVTSNLIWPNGLTVDKSKKHLYWTDAKLHLIQRSDFDGNYRKVIFQFDDESHPYGIAVTNTKIYWTDWKSLALYSANKSDTTKSSIITGNLQGLMDVKVIDSFAHLQDNTCKNSNGGCSHLCLRNPGSYSCQCPTGVKMKPDGQNCEELPSNFLLIALRSGIGRISLDTPEMFDVVLPIEGVYGAVVVDFHYKKNLLFYADVNADAVKRVNMKNFNDVKTIVSKGLSTPNGIAVDWIADNIYWSDSEYKIIEVSRLDGSSRKTILRDNLDDVRSIILYRNLLFFSDWSDSTHSAARIERTLLDGSDRKVIINSDLGFPVGLAIDFESKRLFWADALHDRVDTCDFDGKRRSRVINHADHPFGFTLTQSYYYYTDWFNKSVIRIPRQNSINQEEVRHNLRGALEIRSVSAERQPDYFNPCNDSNGGCPYLCLYLGGRQYVCECPNEPSSLPCKKELRDSLVDPPADSDYIPTSTEGGALNSHPPNENSSLMICILIFLSVVLIAVVSAIAFLVYSSKKKEDERLTFTNPNYHPDDHKSTFFKKFKYDRAQDRVYEEKVINSGHETELSTMTNPSPMPSHSGILPTIG